MTNDMTNDTQTRYVIRDATGRELMRVTLDPNEIEDAKDRAQSSEGFFMANYVTGLETLGRRAVTAFRI